MPALPPLLAATAFTVGGVAVSVGTVLTVSVGLGLTVISAVQASRRTAAVKPSDGQQNIREAVGSRIRHYGRVRTGGQTFLFESKGGRLYFGVALGQGPVTALVQLYLNENPVTIDGAGNVTTFPYTKNGNVYSRLYIDGGGPDQVANSVLLSELPEIWTANHRLRGQVYLLGVFDSAPQSIFNEVYPDGRPILNAVLDTTYLYDPRTGGGAFSENPALAWLNYLTHPDGMNLPLAKMDLASFSAAADVCDQLVSLKTGGTEKRYRIGLSYRLTDDPADTAAAILATFGGEPYYTADGKLGVRAGAYTAPTVTLDLDRIAFRVETVRRTDATSKYNTLVPVYTDPALGYKEGEAQAWQDATLLAEHGLELTERFEVFGCPSASQARRLAKIKIAADNPEWMITAEVNAAGLAAIGEQRVQVVSAEFGLNLPCRVLKADISAAGVLFELASEDPAAWTWNPATEEGDPPALPPPVTVDDIETPVITSVATVVAGASWYIEVTTNAPARQDLAIEMQIRRISPAPVMAWQPTTAEAGNTSPVQSGALQDAGTYEYRLRFVAPDATAGNWTAVGQIYGGVAGGAPGAITAVSVGLSTNDPLAVLHWTQAASANANRTQLFRDGGLIATVNAAPGAVKTFNTLMPAPDVTYTYTGRALATDGTPGPTVTIGLGSYTEVGGGEP